MSTGPTITEEREVTTVMQPPPRGLGKDTISILIAVGATIIALLLPTPEGLSEGGHRIAALFLGMMVLWVSEALPVSVTSILAIALQPVVLLGTETSVGTVSGDLGRAFANFVSPVFFFLIGMFALALAWTKTGLSQRYALWIISKGGTDAKRSIYVFAFGTGLMSTVISDVPACAIFMAIAMGILKKLDLKPGSQYGKVLMLTIPIAALIGGIGTPAGSAINIIGISMIEQSGGERIPFLYWMAIGIPMVILLLPIAAFVLVRLFPLEIKTIRGVDEVERELRALGPLSTAEKKVIAIMSTMVVLWIASTWIASLDIVLISLLGAAVMFLPGIKLFTWEELRTAMGWEIMLMAGAITSIGIASNFSGLAQWLVDTSLGGIETWSPVAIVAIISAFTVLVHLVLPVNPVINAVMIPPIMLLAMASGVNPALYALPVVFTASAAILLPLDPVPLITFQQGYYKMTDMFVPGIIISIFWVIVITILFLTIGPIIGFI